jgi:hypothetical protein
VSEPPAPSTFATGQDTAFPSRWEGSNVGTSGRRYSLKRRPPAVQPWMDQLAESWSGISYGAKPVA